MYIMFTIPGNLKFECSHMLHGLSSPFYRNVHYYNSNIASEQSILLWHRRFWNTISI